MLTRQEKERLVLEQYNQGKTIRDIAKELRMSFRDIGAILKKASAEENENGQTTDKMNSILPFLYLLNPTSSFPRERLP